MNKSKKNDPRFWSSWKGSGAVATRGASSARMASPVRITRLYLSFTTFERDIFNGKLDPAMSEGAIAFLQGDKAEKLRIHTGWAQEEGEDFNRVLAALEAGERSGRIIWFEPNMDDRRHLAILRTEGLSWFLAAHHLPIISLVDVDEATETRLLRGWDFWVHEELRAIKAPIEVLSTF